MPHDVLITGGAGFIGSHLADELLRRGHRVRALDNLDPQVHGPGRKRPQYLSKDVELLVGDVRDHDAVERALDRVEVVFHFASRVGVGQSMYRIEDYSSVNVVGTAVLLEALAKRPLARLVVASSMSIYGEGLYRAAGGALVAVAGRSLEQLRRGDWELRGHDGAALEPVPTPETKAPALESVYALGKYDQERLCLMFGRAYGIPVTALRFFNVFGPRQALSNPYTGVLAIFASRLMNGRAPLVFEDGLQRRDFVSVYDVARACVLAMNTAPASSVFNIGSGRAHTIRDVARSIASALGKSVPAEITSKYRVGDIRHCFADTTHAMRALGFVPTVRFDAGVRELTEWLVRENASAHDRVETAHTELASRGLTL